MQTASSMYSAIHATSCHCNPHLCTCALVRLQRPTASLLLWLALFAPCTAFAAEADLGPAREMVQQGQYKQAYELLAPLESAGTGNAEFNLLLAEAALETGNAGLFANFKNRPALPHGSALDIIAGKGCRSRLYT